MTSASSNVFQAKMQYIQPVNMVASSLSGIATNAGGWAGASATAAGQKAQALQQAYNQALSLCNSTYASLLQTAGDLRGTASAVAQAMSTIAGMVHGA